MDINKKELKINWTVFGVLFGYPALTIAGVISYCNTYGAGWFEWSFAILAYYMSTISVGVGLHRLWAHGTYKVNKVVELFLMLLSSGTLQGPAIAWASDHDLHHRHTDDDSDPHSPLQYANKIKGFLWSHAGWMLFSPTHKKIEKSTIVRLGKNKILIFQIKHYWKLAMFMNLIVPFLLGYLVGGTIQAAIASYLFIGLGRAIQQEVTFCVNSLCHFMGSKQYVNNTAGDISWMFFLLLGENYHNFHHAFARDYRNGWKFYHLDIHKWIIYVMSKIGLASDLVVTPTERILAKKAEVKLQMAEQIQSKLNFIESTASRIVECAQQHFKTLEEGAGRLADNFHETLVMIEDKSQVIISKIQKGMNNYTDKSQKKLVAIASKKLAKLKDFAERSGVCLDLEQNALN